MIALDAFSQRHRQRFGGDAALFAAPGRVNLIGEHTDYNDGFVLPMAIDRYTVAGISASAAPVLRVFSEALDAAAEVDLRRPFSRRGDWTDYVAGVAAAVNSDAALPGGADISIGGDLPLGAGLSSSASVELALALALYHLAGVRAEPKRLARAGSRAEHEYVGIRSGVMDQLVCALGQDGCALFIDCRSLAAEPVNLPSNALVAVFDTGVKHALAASEYNARRASCEEGVRLLNERGYHLRALRDISSAEYSTAETSLPSPVRERCRHVVEENERTLEAVEALRAGDLHEAGRLFDQSHRSLRDLYEVTCPELDEIVEIARGVRGVYGSRMTGGGFGGAAIALIEPHAFGELSRALQKRYYAPRGMRNLAFAARAVSGAHAL